MTLNRRSFFKRLVQTAAVVALAPRLIGAKAIEIAPVEVPNIVAARVGFWYQTTRESLCMDDGYLDALKQIDRSYGEYLRFRLDKGSWVHVT